MNVHTIDTSAGKKISKKLRNTLYKRSEILFVYLYGSFLKGSFRDIDIGVYLQDTKNKSGTMRYELTLENELGRIMDFHVDVRVINYAPLSFRFNVIKHGMLLFSKDESKRSDFECLTIVEYQDFKFYRDSYRREAIGLGV